MTKLLGLPVLATEHGAEVDLFILYVHFLMGALFVGWLAYFVYVLFRFRRTRNPKANYIGVRSHASSYIEGVVALIEALLLIGFAIPLWARVVDEFPEGKDATVIRVVAEQFLWNPLYPGKDGVFGSRDLKFVSSENPFGLDPDDPNGKDDLMPGRGTAINVFYAPVGKPVIAHITSKDVVHSFKVGPFRMTQDAIPGLSIPTHFKPTRTGQYLINCAQLCGNSHYFMKGYFNVVSQEEYDEWLSNATAEAERAAAGGADAGGFE